MKKYLKLSGVPYREDGSYLVIKCMFENCKVDNALHIDTEKKTYLCKACGKKGQSPELAAYFPKVRKANQKKELNETETVRVVKVKTPEQEVSFEEWQKTITLNFPELLFASEVGLSVLAQILIKDITNPFALVFVDVPSAGKTIAINFFAEIEGLTYASDKFTPASFVSNATNVKKEKLKDIDLLPRLRYKMFLIRDLATLFSKRDDDLNESLGLLTRVLDGEGLNTDTGVHGQRQYVGEYLFMVLAGSTPIPPRVWKMMGNLGSRLFFLSMNSREKSEDELVNQLTSTAHKEKEKECREKTKDFLYTLWHKHSEGIEWNKEGDSDELKRIVARSAKLLAKLRGVVNLWKDNGEQGEEFGYTVPVVEKPDRVSQLLYNLARGHALISGRTSLAAADVRPVIELAIDSAPTIRAKLFRKLLENEGRMKTSEVETSLQCSKPTALKEMETLKILEVCTIEEDRGHVGEPEKVLCLNKSFEWFLSDECKNMRGMYVKPKQGTLSGMLD